MAEERKQAPQANMARCCQRGPHRSYQTSPNCGATSIKQNAQRRPLTARMNHTRRDTPPERMQDRFARNSQMPSARGFAGTATATSRQQTHTDQQAWKSTRRPKQEEHLHFTEGCPRAAVGNACSSRRRKNENLANLGMHLHGTTKVGEAFLCKALASVSGRRNARPRRIQGPARGARLRKVLSASANARERQITARSGFILQSNSNSTPCNMQARSKQHAGQTCGARERKSNNCGHEPS